MAQPVDTLLRPDSPQARDPDQLDPAGSPDAVGVLVPVDLPPGSGGDIGDARRDDDVDLRSSHHVRLQTHADLADGMRMGV